MSILISLSNEMSLLNKKKVNTVIVTGVLILYTNYYLQQCLLWSFYPLICFLSLAHNIATKPFHTLPFATLWLSIV